jgi:glutaconate CoA-transferase subunit B
MMPYHDRRNFVEQVDYISGVGFPGGMEGRKTLGLLGGGPKYIYTPKCIFSFDNNGEIFLRSLHPGISLDNVIANTGFSFSVPDELVITKEPSDEELRILRNEIDVKGILFARERM